MAKIEEKDFKFDYKVADEKDEFMTVTGMVSPYDGKADLGGDIIEKGAYTRTLDQKGQKRVLLWHHQSKEPIGKGIVEDTKDGLVLKEGLIAKAVGRGKDTATLIKMEALDGISIGYRAIKTAFSAGSRILKEIALEEVSIVPFPMNTGSRVDSFKSDDEFNEILNDIIKKEITLNDNNFELVNALVKKFNVLLLARKNIDPLSSIILTGKPEPTEQKISDEFADKFKQLLQGMK